MGPLLRRASCGALRGSSGNPLDFPGDVSQSRRASTPSSRPPSASTDNGTMPSMGLQGATATVACRSPCRMQQVREECVERRAREAAAKLERAKEHQQRIDQSKRMIVTATVALSNDSGFGKAVAALVEERRELLKVLDENGALDESRLQEFILEAKHKQFGEKMMMLVPWSLSERQKLVVVQRLLVKCSLSELRSFGRDDVASQSSETAWKDALQSAMQSSSEFTCPICMDPLIQLSNTGEPITSNIWFAPIYKNEHWSNQPCGHACCRTCMGAWAESSINDQKANIRCPAANCRYSLFDHDLWNLVSVDAF